MSGDRVTAAGEGRGESLGANQGRADPRDEGGQTLPLRQAFLEDTGGSGLR
jgi:hypothetical protein